MSISSLLATERVFTNAEISSKKRLLEYIAEKAANELQIARSEIYNQLLERERLGSTGLGEGFAVPHARLNNLDQTHACFVKLDEPINYDAIDRQPVDLVFVILIPEASTEEHLRILASLAKIFSDQAVCDQIRNTESTEQILDIIQQAEQRQQESS
jgi:PTS system nitrogen regulatory IIA component